MWDVPVLFSEEAGLAAIAERKRPEDRTEEDKMALLGRPRLGDIIRAQIRVKESKEFKVGISLSNCGYFYFLIDSNHLNGNNYLFINSSWYTGEIFLGSGAVNVAENMFADKKNDNWILPSSCTYLFWNE